MALSLLGRAIRKLFLQYFPNPDQLKKGREKDPFGTIRAWFAGGNTLELLNDSSDREFREQLESVAGLRKLVEKAGIDAKEVPLYMELVLHGLAEFNVINKDFVESRFSFRDLLASMLDDDFDEDDDEDDLY